MVSLLEFYGVYVMKHQFIHLVALIAMCVGFPILASAAEPASPDELVRGLTDRLTSLLKEEVKTTDPDFYRNVVEETLGPFIDFRSISRRVMAKHYKSASPEQRKRFANSFRESLLNTYANGVSTLSDQKIKILPFKGVQKKGKKERAKVEMEIRTPDGVMYPITYAVYKNKVGDWRLENIILNGVNLGLTFRNQFNEAHRANDGDIDKVIEAWSVKLAAAKVSEGNKKK